ncbi:hypothetical protein BY996DRAFT_47226 [Phakopsora pachyrhizi]|uniref:Expressed protein n=1 Tax=Phakopsora pachyrhizi TaxID=170000 RepID=A0AAV0B3Z4_PHAPC|nr:hypothetical protein BY996DRAFT_47226 [Phakopsora pachyrhizi]CAH7677677.1 expressed protein [Phakopsora pachyrhizi]
MKIPSSITLFLIDYLTPVTRLSTKKRLLIRKTIKFGLILTHPFNLQLFLPLLLHLLQFVIQIPVQFQQKAAELSSLIVRTIMNQMISNPGGPCHQNHSRNSDEQLLTLNPVVALLFVVVVMSMWASKKVGPQSLHQWNHLLCSTHYGSNFDNESEKADRDVDQIKMIGDLIKVVELSGSPSKAAPVELIPFTPKSSSDFFVSFIICNSAS